ncbi:uncharacterized protein LOC129729304 [Wyeomyia smithii]|uniref:uncharacterized protein LOC129729304 n=1 Tax=Wyeomyia smithii TaxID=174621 RepID=UPI002467F239|nr:uncharacterized protein LOC129729304 [Wyeomyia smithii]
MDSESQPTLAQDKYRTLYAPDNRQNPCLHFRTLDNSSSQPIIGPRISYSHATNSPLHLYYQNASGMNSNIDDYLLAFSDSHYDFIALTETWLDDRTLTSHLFGAEYEGFRCDRGPQNSQKKTGGGVLIAVRCSLKPRQIVDAAWNNLEQVWVSVQLSGRKLYICVVYFPPERTRDKQLIDTHIQSVLAIHDRVKRCDEIVVIGDFNLPNLYWAPKRSGFLYPDPDRSNYHACALNLLDGYNAAMLEQINNNVNENGRCLDLCFVSTRDIAPRLTFAPAPLVKTVSHHPALLLDFDEQNSLDYQEPVQQPRYDFKRTDYDGLLEALLIFDWANNLNPTDVDMAVDDFLSIVTGMIARFVPRKRVRPHKYLPWQSTELRRLKRIKNATFKRYSASGTLSLRNHYRSVNQEYKTLRRRCYANYRRKIERKLKTDPKQFWNFVNAQRKETGLPSVVELATEKADNSSDICRLFAAKFASVFVDESLTTTQISAAASKVALSSSSIASIDIDDRAILAAVTKLKNSNWSGPDGIPATLLKKCIPGLVTALTHLFRLSMSSGRFPLAWKQAYMFPVHKKVIVAILTTTEEYRHCVLHLNCSS